MILLLTQVPSTAHNDQIYILKKSPVPINAENFRDLLLFGRLSPSPLLQLSSTVKQVTITTSILFCVNAIEFLLYCFLTCLYEFWVNSFSLFNKVCAPLLSNHKKHHMWPNLLSDDILRHVERLCSETSVVQGWAFGRTVLPIPTATNWIENSYRTLKM